MAVEERLVCPVTRAPLSVEADRARGGGREYRRDGGIWRMNPRAEEYVAFTRAYEAVREAEGRRGLDTLALQQLPYGPAGSPNDPVWRIRAKTYEALVAHVVPRVLRASAPLALDLGAGHCWLSNRLAQLGFEVAAIDVLANNWDGLGAFAHYPRPITPIEAEFDRLPIADRAAGLVVFNASLHYSASYERTLAEALRVLAPAGVLAILDTPLYRDAATGNAMLAERRAARGEEVLPHEGFLTEGRLEEVGAALGLEWTIVEPFLGWKAALRPWWRRLRGRRPGARWCAIFSGSAAG